MMHIYVCRFGHATGPAGALQKTPGGLRVNSIDMRWSGCDNQIILLPPPANLEFYMLLNVTVDLTYSAMQASDSLLLIEASTDSGQVCHNNRLLMMSGTDTHLIAGEDNIGQRRWISVTSQLQCRYEAQIEVTRPSVDLTTLSETPRAQLPAPVINYLMPSRYCQSDLFLDFTFNQFKGQKGGQLVQAMRDWIATNFTYDNDVSNAGTTAVESFQALRGVCRDFAHVLIALVRAAGIPARFVGAYAPNVTPQDFHAVVEVYLEGAWHLVDATGMAQQSDIVRICVGRDAADTSFLTSYGAMTMIEQTVQVVAV